MKRLSIVLVLLMAVTADIVGMKRSCGEFDSTDSFGSQIVVAPAFDFSQIPDDVVNIFVAVSNRKNILRLVSKQFHMVASFCNWKKLVTLYPKIVDLSDIDRERMYAKLIADNDVYTMCELLKTDRKVSDYLCDTVLHSSPLQYRNSANMVTLEYARSFEMRKLLVVHGASFEYMVNDDNPTLASLWNPIMQGDLDSVKLFLDTKMFSAKDLAEKNHECDDALTIAACYGCYDIAWLILKSGYDVAQGGDAFLKAVSPRYQTHTALAELLLEYHVAANGDENTDCKPLYGLIESGDVHLITKCVRAGAQLEVWDGYIDDRSNQCSPLSHAISLQNPIVVATLLDLGADPKYRVNDDDELPLAKAQRLGNQKIIDMFVKKI
jgi:ankyrin repeat protein